jgi:hypothetical protein
MTFLFECREMFFTFFFFFLVIYQLSIAKKTCLNEYVLGGGRGGGSITGPLIGGSNFHFFAYIGFEHDMQED